MTIATTLHRIAMNLVVVALLLVAAGPVSAQTPTAPASMSPNESAASSSVPGTPAVPDTPAGRALAWVLDQLGGDPSQLSDEELTNRFAPIFLDQVPANQVRTFLEDSAAQGPWRVLEVTEQRGPTGLDAIISSDSAANLVTITTEGPESDRIAGLRFQPAPAETWDEVDSALQALGQDVGFLAASVEGRECAPIHAIDASARLSVGSAFKLYVLGALALAVERGDASWTELLPIEDGLDSLPTGRLQHVPPGTPFTLRYYAELMISQSDNTATDHLISRLGSEEVEVAMEEMGHGDPAVNVPFLRTNEYFRLKHSVTDDVRQAYMAAGPEDRRALLADEVADTPLPALEAVTAVTEPRYVDELGWFASADDLCRALAFLYQQGQSDGLRPVVEIASLNPGIALDRATWPIVLFKGGSDVGVLNVSFLMQRADGPHLALILTVNDPAEPVSTEDAVSAVEAAAGYLASADALS